MSGNLSRVNLQEKSKIFKIPTQIWGQSNGAGQKYYKNQVRVKSKHIHMYKLPTLQEQSKKGFQKCHQTQTSSFHRAL